ncbi:IS6 family transposase, partial [Lacticaseibacillus paracasei]|nr:IS6 family transposase [Lacticaseibacillus paracasei]
MTDHFKGRQFNQSVITFVVGYYLRYNISYRDLVEMMRDRGIFVHHTTLMRWVQHYSP